MKALLATSLLVLATPIWAVDPGHYCDQNTAGRFSNRYTYNSDNTVTDRVTGLKWQRCPLGDGMIKTQNHCGLIYQYKWQEALDWENSTKTQDANRQQPNPGDTAAKLHQAGWRLPNVKELLSLLELHCRSPKVDLDAFPIDQYTYWSNTPDIANVASVTLDAQIPSATNGTTKSIRPYGAPDATKQTATIVAVKEDLSIFHQAYYVDFSGAQFLRGRLSDEVDTETKLPKYVHAVLLVCEKSQACGKN